MLLVMPGCALDRGAIVDRAGRMDAAQALVDGGRSDRDARTPDDPIDAALPVDGRVSDRDARALDVSPDAGLCAPRCEGSRIVTCTGGGAMIDCASVGASCQSSSPGPRCVGGACAEPLCSDDASAVLRCTGGIPETPLACERGCDPAMPGCRSELTCEHDTLATIATGTMTIDLCGGRDDHDHDGNRPCAAAADGEDVLLRLNVDRAGGFRITADDVEGGARVDPVLYVRRVCAERESEVACNDDVGDGDLDSQLDVDLDPGEYFLIVDSIDSGGGGTECGEVALAVNRM